MSKRKHEPIHFNKHLMGSLDVSQAVKDLTGLPAVSYTHLDVYKRQVGKLAVPFRLEARDLQEVSRRLGASA